MTKFIGQEKLVQDLTSFTLQTLPHTLLLTGPSGCGKHTLVNSVIAPYYKLQVLDITDRISLETIDTIYTAPTTMFYTIDLTKTTEKEQNILLKLIEEPRDNCYLILFCSNVHNLLPTIKNRCIEYRFKPYSFKELLSFNKNVNEKIVENICETPGDVLLINTQNLESLQNLCKKIIYNMKQANYSNAMSIVDKLNYSDEYDKYSLDLFMKVLLFQIVEEYANKNVDKLFTMYNIVSQIQKKLQFGTVNKKYVIINLISKLWSYEHGFTNT